MRRPAPVLVVVVALAAGLACGAQPEDVDPVALEAGLAGTRTEEGPGPRTADPLPLAGAEPHAVRVFAQLNLLEPGERARRVSVSRDVLVGEGGAFHILDRRVWVDPDRAPQGLEDGREVLYDGKRLAVRRAWGPWMARETLGGQEERLLREAHDALPAVLAAFGPYMAWSPAPGPPTVAGLPVTWEEATLDAAVVPRELDEAALRAMRDHAVSWTGWLAATHRPASVEGRVARRADGVAEVVGGSLAVRGTAVVEGLQRDFLVQVRQVVEELPADADLDWPAEVLPARRARPWRMIEDVLGDALSPAYGGGASAGTSPATQPSDSPP